MNSVLQISAFVVREVLYLFLLYAPFNLYFTRFSGTFSRITTDLVFIAALPLCYLFLVFSYSGIRGDETMLIFSTVILPTAFVFLLGKTTLDILYKIFPDFCETIFLPALAGLSLLYGVAIAGGWNAAAHIASPKTEISYNPAYAGRQIGFPPEITLPSRTSDEPFIASSALPHPVLHRELGEMGYSYYNPESLLLKVHKILNRGENGRKKPGRNGIVNILELKYTEEKSGLVLTASVYEKTSVPGGHLKKAPIAEIKISGLPGTFLYTPRPGKSWITKAADKLRRSNIAAWLLTLSYDPGKEIARFYESLDTLLSAEK